MLWLVNHHQLTKQRQDFKTVTLKSILNNTSIKLALIPGNPVFCPTLVQKKISLSFAMGLLFSFFFFFKHCCFVPLLNTFSIVIVNIFSLSYSTVPKEIRDSVVAKIAQPVGKTDSERFSRTCLLLSTYQMMLEGYPLPVITNIGEFSYCW